MTTQPPTDALRLVPESRIEDLTRPIVGMNMRSAHEVFDIMADRFRGLMKSAAPASPLPEGGGWQDISTAPKDGTIILTYGSLHNDGAPYGIGETPTVKISQYSKEGEFWCCDAWGSHEPVWWMPLPAAPTGELK